MLKIFSLLKKQIFLVVSIIFLLILYTLANLALPAIMSAIVNQGINSGDMSIVIKYSLIMLGIAVFGLIIYIISGKIGSIISSRFFAELAGKVYNKTISLKYGEFSKIGASALLTRSTEDIHMINEMTMSLIGMVATVPTLFIGGIILSFKEDVMLSLIILFLMPLVFLLVLVIGRRIVPRWEIADKYIDDQNQIVRERMNGIRVIRAYNNEAYEHQRLKKSTELMADNIIRANTMSGLINPIALLFLNVCTVLVAYIGAVRLGNSSSITAGSVIAVMQYVGLIMSALSEIFFVIVFLPKIKVSCRRINEVLETPPLVEPTDDLSVPINGNIRFVDTEFIYEGADTPAVSGINIEILNGETVAIIGGTGSGKTTLLNMLLKFYPVSSGKIEVNGLNLCNISCARIRESISVAMQKSVVLKGTISDNIKMGKQNATEEEMIAAAKTAQLYDYIMSLPNKFEHKLEQNGTNISGGQKQRLAIARALIKDAPIYVFDDSFSALDFLTESRLRKELNSSLSGKTQIIITQRVATAMSADKIFVMDNGRLIGTGNHLELMKNCPIYKAIYDSQIGGDLDEK